MFAENEKLPLELGWVRPEEPFVIQQLEDFMERILNATNTDPN
jgi:hypothetical protein